MDLLDDNDLLDFDISPFDFGDASLDNRTPSSSSALEKRRVSMAGVSETDSSEDKTSTQSEEKGKNKKVKPEKKRDREDEEEMLQIHPEAVVLPREVELEVSSLEMFDDYVKRLQESRNVPKSEKESLMQQRKRIRNRLYALKKRQKEKEGKIQEKGVVEQLRQENENLKREVLHLRNENAKLKSALAGSGFSVKTGSFFALAVFVTFSFFVNPVSLLSRGSPSTGRVLMSNEAPMSAWGVFAKWVSSLMFGGSSGRAIMMDFPRLWVPPLAILDASYFVSLNQTHAEFVWALQMRDNCTLQREFVLRPEVAA